MKKTISIFALAAVVGLALGAEKAVVRLVGTWRLLAAMSSNSSLVSPNSQVVWTFSSSELRVRKPLVGEERATYRISGDNTAQSLDITFTNQTRFCIYRCDGTNLTIAYVTSSPQRRPKDFTVTNDTVVLEFKRE